MMRGASFTPAPIPTPTNGAPWQSCASRDHRRPLWHPDLYVEEAYRLNGTVLIYGATGYRGKLIASNVAAKSSDHSRHMANVSTNRHIAVIGVEFLGPGDDGLAPCEQELLGPGQGNDDAGSRFHDVSARSIASSRSGDAAPSRSLRCPSSRWQSGK
jgi:hypothetical protein